MADMERSAQGQQTYPRAQPGSEKADEAMLCREGVAFGGLGGVGTLHLDSVIPSEHKELAQWMTRSIVLRCSLWPFES